MKDARGNEHDRDGTFGERQRAEADVGPLPSPPGPWAQGAQKIRDFLQQGHLERIEVDERFVETQLQDAEDNIESAEQLARQNPRLAYVALYDAARYAIEAALAKQGLRATRQGGHTVAIDALTAQLGQVGAFLKPMNRIRKRRIDAEYPYPDTPLISVAEVHDDLPKVTIIVAEMRKFVAVIGEF